MEDWNFFKTCKSNTLLWVFSKFFKLYQWYQIARSIKNESLPRKTALRQVGTYIHQHLVISSMCYTQYPANNYLFKANNSNIRKKYETCSKLTIKTPEQSQWCRSGIFTVTLNVFHIFLVLLLLTLNK